MNVRNLPAVQNVNVVWSPIVDRVYAFAANATGTVNGAFISDAMDTTVAESSKRS